jgi:hypothetical protein
VQTRKCDGTQLSKAAAAGLTSKQLPPEILTEEEPATMLLWLFVESKDGGEAFRESSALAKLRSAG